jgi:predicted SprT family Zn-dependent metalloprotease
MHPHDARLLAIRLISEHGLSDWKFRFDHARRRFGSCQARLKLITLSRTLTILNSQDQVRDTILHEIAHAMTPDDGHGAKWREACVRVGATPKRCYDDQTVLSPPRSAAQYRVGCKACQWWVDRRRTTRKRMICVKCKGPIVYQHKSSGLWFDPTRQRIVRSTSR